MMVAAKSIENSRLMRYQSFNAYRKRFNMKSYASFEELTGEKVNSKAYVNMSQKMLLFQTLLKPYLKACKTVYLDYKEI